MCKNYTRYRHIKLATLAIITSIAVLINSACSSGAFVVANLPLTFKDVQITKDVSYGDEDWQKLDVYAPKNLSEKAPVLVFFYGGRWSEGRKEQYAFTALPFVNRGYVVVIPDYSKYPKVKFPTFVEDGARAVAWTHNNITNYNGSADEIFISGHSSGAHIGALITANPRYLKFHDKNRSVIRAFAGLAGPYDFVPEDADLKDMFGPPKNYPKMQVPTFIDGQQPPMFLLHGEKDETVIQRNLNHLHDKIKSKGGAVKTKIYPEINHVDIIAALSWVKSDVAPIADDIDAFFKSFSIN